MTSDRASGEAAFQQLGRRLQSQSVLLKGEVSEVAVYLRIIQVDQSIEEDTIVCFIIRLDFGKIFTQPDFRAKFVTH